MVPGQQGCARRGPRTPGGSCCASPGAPIRRHLLPHPSLVPLLPAPLSPALRSPYIPPSLALSLALFLLFLLFSSFSYFFCFFFFLLAFFFCSSMSLFLLFLFSSFSHFSPFPLLVLFFFSFLFDSFSLPFSFPLFFSFPFFTSFPLFPFSCCSLAFPLLSVSFPSGAGGWPQPQQERMVPAGLWQPWSTRSGGPGPIPPGCLLGAATAQPHSRRQKQWAGGAGGEEEVGDM